MAQLAENQNTYENQGIAEELAEEEQYAAELAAEQELYNIQRQIQQLDAKGQSFGRPSLLKYGLLLVLAILTDTIIIGSYLLFGAGIFISTLLASPFIISIILVSWFTDTKLKSAQAHPEEVGKAVILAQQRIATATRMGLRTAKALRKVPGMKGVARAIPRGLVKVRRVARRSPVGRILVGSGANSVPIINLIPWQIVSVFMAYSAEKKTLEEARQATNEAIEQLQAQVVAI
ncbi:MAG: hypothetical protein COU09_00735 [Candidatus Harrisonbacteria bacterium CG10_big_fil_rev_8_21_14_0_10_44_23]|uniref:Uncharacterized protein n=1 Tax=Candidatus Harrisonbacteria bacterium CG10_big_fil_rev_8_21_14_0_10_44_23 TaxID=1974585 RepID=A0A2H0UQJ6_9BACT|nr:MAG: hypothetical protein COU09_00735 [Candidatus Harrisonbacteria bacterium CG10_big_fil_rev_8_21_14_0_10_44_23]